jgi:hypothetical protein
MSYIVKPYNYKGQLELLTENISLDDFYVKKQIYEVIFGDIDLFFVYIQDEKRKHYKLKQNKPVVCVYDIQTIDGIKSVQIDYSILH